MSDKPSMFELMKMAKKIQSSMRDAHKQMDALRVSGEAGAGMVRITIDGHHNIKELLIDDSAFEEDKTILADLITAAMNDANHKLAEQAKSKMGDLSKNMGMPLDLPFSEDDE